MLPNQKSIKITDLSKQIILIYGRSKIGKSTFCSKFPEALFIATEPGLNHLEVFKSPVRNWSEFLNVCSEISKGEHKFKSIIIDTIDKLVVMCSDHICNENGVGHPSEMPHGRGWNLVTSELNRALTKLASLPYGLVMVSHCDDEEVETKTKKYHRWTISLSGKNRGLFLDLPDIILFIDSEVDKEGIERRIIRTKPSMYYDAGDRSMLLPETLPLDFEKFSSYFKQEGGK
jgi:hypothetical protein